MLTTTIPNIIESFMMTYWNHSTILFRANRSPWPEIVKITRRDVNRDVMHRLSAPSRYTSRFKSILSPSCFHSRGLIVCTDSGVIQYTCEILRRGDQFSATSRHTSAQGCICGACVSEGVRYAYGVEPGHPVAHPVKFYRVRNSFS